MGEKSLFVKKKSYESELLTWIREHRSTDDSERGGETETERERICAYIRVRV